jgi:hypothetical protein
VQFTGAAGWLELLYTADDNPGQAGAIGADSRVALNYFDTCGLAPLAAIYYDGGSYINTSDASGYVVVLYTLGVRNDGTEVHTGDISIKNMLGATTALRISGSLTYRLRTHPITS